MFYDLEDPMTFVSDVSEVLHDDGIWILQMADSGFLRRDPEASGVTIPSSELWTGPWARARKGPIWSM
jgi:hypothetical protein